MSMTPPKLIDFASVHDALADLCAGFFEHGREPTHCSEIAPADMPPDARRLLVHNRHMTVTLGEYHGQPVELAVLERDFRAPLYRRKIILTTQGSGQVVEFGVMRMNFAYTSDAVRDQVLAAERPLGEILIRHNVMRRIEPRWFLRFPAFCCHLDYFKQSMPMPAFGRVGTIYCNDEPAIDLLEIVTLNRESTNE